jgi:energy-coupling factor transport system ATP-binding protein
MGFDNNSAVRSAREALTYMNVDEMLWQRSVQALSGGEKRRVGIAGILANTPDYLILDESDAGLDETGIDALSGVVKSYLEAGRCVIVITH